MYLAHYVAIIVYISEKSDSTIFVRFQILIQAVFLTVYLMPVSTFPKHINYMLRYDNWKMSKTEELENEQNRRIGSHY